MPAAVITGDIVNSTLLPKKNVTKLVNELKSLLKPYKFEFYRGDSFQVYIKDISMVLRVALLARAIAKKYSSDIRVSIGIGRDSKPVRSLSTAIGDAFVLSGRAFDLLNDERLRIESYHENANISLRIIAYFLDYIFVRLTPARAGVICDLLKGYTQTEISRRLKKAQPTINKLAQASDWREVERLLQDYPNVIKQFRMV